MTKYNEIMSRVSLTPEMREQVLTGMAEHRQRKQKKLSGNAWNLQGWTRFVPALAAACLILVAGLQIYRTNPSFNEPEAVASEGVNEYTSLSELEEAVGFAVPELEEYLPFENTDTQYTSAFGIARIDYYGPMEENITLSKGKDDGTDVSGDYNEYPSVMEETADGIKVTLKGEEESCSLAIWVEDGYAYAIHSDPGIPYETMMDMIQGIHAPENTSENSGG